MDKETLSNYGWIVICVLVLAVMIALASPFGNFVADAIKSTTQGLFDVNKSALDSTGLINIGDQSFGNGEGEVPPMETKPDFSHLTTIEGCPLRFGVPYSNLDAGYSMSLVAYTDGRAEIYAYNSWKADSYPAGTFTYEGYNIVTDGFVAAVSSPDGQQVEYDGMIFNLDTSWCPHGDTYVKNQSETYTGDTYCVYCNEKTRTGSCTHVHTEIQNAVQDSYTGDTYCHDCQKIIKAGKEYVSFTVTSGNRDKIGYTSETTELVIPASFQDTDGTLYRVTSIADSAFENCTGLTSVVISDSVTSIGSQTFQDCRNLTSVVIGEGVSHIGTWAFRNCNSLTSVGPVGSGASVEIPDSLTSIGGLVFYECTGLTSVVIPDSVTTIGSQAFFGCTGLMSVVIPDSVTQIQYYAFRNCNSLTSVTIPDSVTSIGDMVFGYCTSLDSIKFEGTVTEWNAISKGSNWKYDVPATEVVCSDGTVSLS